MSVTVVVPTAGTSIHLRDSVETVLRSAILTGPDAEVLVVVNGRSDAPVLRDIGSPALRVITLPERNVSRARNVGLDAARNDMVIFGDDGADCDESFCPEVAAALQNTRYPVVTGPVRVPVTGTLTAFLNHQHVFDAPPLSGELAATVTGLCALRRDLVPAHVRYDENLHREVGEDVAFGRALRAAGLPIRWLGALSPGRHRMTDDLSEITNRMMRYGRGAGAVLERVGIGVLGLHRYFGSAGYHRYRRFAEVIDPDVRAAYQIYDYVYDLSFLIGYLMSNDPEHPVLEVDLDGLTDAWSALIPPVGRLIVQPEADFTELDRAAPVDAPLIGEVKEALHRHVSVLRPPSDAADTRRPERAGAGRSVSTDAGHPVEIAGAGSTTRERPLASTLAGSPELARLHKAWDSLRETAGPISAYRVDAIARNAGQQFRDGCAAIERAGLRDSVAAMAA